MAAGNCWCHCLLLLYMYLFSICLPIHAQEVCTEEGAVRFAGQDVGVNKTEGRLEICVNGSWGTVCNDGFDTNAAKVVCRQLGFPEDGVPDIRTSISFGIGGSFQLIHIDDVSCTGNETTLLECPRREVGHNCGHPEDVSVICQRSQDCMDGDVRLVNGDNYNATEGRVEFCVGGLWGTVCNYLWSESDAAVVCRQLGLDATEPRTLPSGSVPPVQNPLTPIVLDGLRCDGFDTRLGDCPREVVVEYCTHENDAGAFCTPLIECNDGDLRLVHVEGDLDFVDQIQYCSSRRWGLVCYDNWDNRDAEVVCRQMGYSMENQYAIATRSRITLSSRPEVLKRVGCDGTEGNISQCSHVIDSDIICLRGGAGVICRKNDSLSVCTDGDVRLQGGSLSNEIGRVEVCASGQWGLVCDDEWDDNDATVVCRQLGYTGGIATHQSIFGSPARGFYALDDVNCTGNESTVFNCQYPPRTLCTVGREEAGVICGVDKGPKDRCTDTHLNKTTSVVGTNMTNLTAGSIGTCQRYLSQSNLCNNIYKSTGYVFTAMNQAVLSKDLDDRVLPILSGDDEECNDLISKVVCHYFFAPCGANGLLHLPLSVCPEECHYVESACESKWTTMNDLLNREGLNTIDCNATSDLLQGLSPCCTNAEVDIIEPPSTVTVQSFCSVVVWTPPQLPCDVIGSYEVRLYDPTSGNAVTRSVSNYTTFYILGDEDKSQFNMESVFVQVRLLHRVRGQSEWSEGITLGCVVVEPPSPPVIHFTLNGQIYMNNSEIPLNSIGENENALTCKTDLVECCGAVPNRFGEFHYPNGVRVPIKVRNHGFYRNRGDQQVRLHRREGTTGPTGRYCCEVPDSSGVMQRIYIGLV